MRVSVVLGVVMCALSFATEATAQDFGVLESAETINPGNFKLGAYPLFPLPAEGDTDFRFAIAVGYGFTDVSTSKDARRSPTTSRFS